MSVRSFISKMSENSVQINYSECEPLPARMTLEYFNQFVVKLSGKIMHLRDSSETKFLEFHNKLHHLESALNLIEKKLGLDELMQVQYYSCCTVLQKDNFSKLSSAKCEHFL